MKNHKIVATAAVAAVLTFGHSAVHAEADDAGIKSFDPVSTPSAAEPEEATTLVTVPSAAPMTGANRSATDSKGVAKAAVFDGLHGLRAIVARHAAAQGVPFALADAVVRIESRYNPRASNRGNFGLMQIRHQTARGLGYGGSAAGLLDAETNARFGMMYLAKAYRMTGGDTCRTVMKYQSGHMATQMSSANRAYCAKVRTYVASL